MTVSNETIMNTAEDSEEVSKSSNKHRYVMMFKSSFDRELFPNNFDFCTIEEQCVWIDENIATFFPNVPKSLINLIPATREGDYDRSPMEIPKWLDLNKYRRGQQFVRDNYTSIIIATILGLMHVYSFEDSLKPIIISKRSHTPYLGFKRYASTIQRFFNWYYGEPWIKGTLAYEDMQFARKMHSMIRAKLCKLDNEKINNESKIVKLWCPDHELFLKDFATVCPFDIQRPYVMFTKSPYNSKGMNNADMAVTQCSFISSIVLYPQKIGVHATDEDVEAFCHMWRCYGYYLGIENEYNMCRGNLEDIKQRVRDCYQYWILSNFKNITPEWEHMTRCLVEPLNYYPFIYMPYKVIALYAADVLNIRMPSLCASMSYAEWIAYKCYRFILHYAIKFSIIRVIINKVVLKIFNKAMNFSPEKEAELQKKSEMQLSKLDVMR
ncbi:uncharacterized protein LOC105837610 [Monomorium pharaonis]|uniref:uncharacterized protein LOC105837610 n=1 Tax=Monomorium pharaonis TaxID=307658 RepID=UPI001746E678|nr:uncharacterized protein LOC105837610 [Monomorium pharaonis]